MEHVRFASLDSQWNINLLRFASIIKFFNMNKFASLRNLFSNCRMCSLCFDIKEKIIIEAFASLRYHCHYWPTFQYFLRSLWLQRLMLLLKVSTLQGPELYLNVSALQRPVLLLEVSTPQGLELHLNVSAQQRLVLLLKLSTPQGPSCIWTCLHYRHVPTYCRKCSLRFVNNFLSI